MMPGVLELERELRQLRSDFSTWRRDAAPSPIRHAEPSGAIGHTQFAVVREIGAGTEPYIMVQRLRQISSDQRWAFVSATYEQVACFSDLVSAENKPFVCTIPGEYAIDVGFIVVMLVRANLSWIALPWTAPEMVAIEDLPEVPRTDCFPPVAGDGVPTPLTGENGDGDGLVPATFDSLEDVTIAADVAAGEIPAWDAVTEQWINRTLTEAGIAALAHATRHQVGGADVVQTAICEVSTTPPAVTAVGQLWYDTDATGSSVSSTVNLVIKSADYTLTADDVAVFGNATLTLTLPTAVGISGKTYEIKNIGTGRVTIACDGSETIEEVARIVLPPKTSRDIRSDNANWWIK